MMPHTVPQLTLTIGQCPQTKHVTDRSLLGLTSSYTKLSTAHFIRHIFYYYNYRITTSPVNTGNESDFKSAAAFSDITNVLKKVSKINKMLVKITSLESMLITKTIKL